MNFYESFIDELQKIAAKGVVPKRSTTSIRQRQGMGFGTRFLKWLEGAGKAIRKRRWR